MARTLISRNGLINRVAVITGATSGIGRATALVFAEAGANIIIGDVRERPIDNGMRTADVIREAGGRAIFVETDVADKIQVARLAQRAVREFGRVDILVNNAGIGHISAVEHTPDHVLRRLVEVNFYGMVYGVQAVLPVMQAQGGGHIINISSGAALLGLPYASFYAATKAAMVRFSEALRYELEGSNIDVSIIYPDLTATDLALEVTPSGSMETRTVRSLNSEGLEKYGAPGFRPQSPVKVAHAVLACALRPRGELYLSPRIRFHALFRILFPMAVEHEARRIRSSVQKLLAKISGEYVQTPEGRAP